MAAESAHLVALGAGAEEEEKNIAAGGTAGSGKAQVARIPVEPKKWGDLHVNIIGAKLTTDTAALGKMDPYVKISFRNRNKNYQTKVHSAGGKTPIWN